MHTKTKMVKHHGCKKKNRHQCHVCICTSNLQELMLLAVWDVWFGGWHEDHFSTFDHQPDLNLDHFRCFITKKTKIWPHISMGFIVLLGNDPRRNWSTFGHVSFCAVCFCMCFKLCCSLQKNSWRHDLRIFFYCIILKMAWPNTFRRQYKSWVWGRIWTVHLEAKVVAEAGSQWTSITSCARKTQGQVFSISRTKIVGRPQCAWCSKRRGCSSCWVSPRAVLFLQHSLSRSSAVSHLFPSCTWTVELHLTYISVTLHHAHPSLNLFVPCTPTWTFHAARPVSLPSIFHWASISHESRDASSHTNTKLALCLQALHVRGHAGNQHPFCDKTSFLQQCSFASQESAPPRHYGTCAY